MSDLHSQRPFLHVCVILVVFAHCVLLTTERSGRHSLSHYHREPDVDAVYVPCLTGKVEVLFNVCEVPDLFNLRQVVDFSWFSFLYVELNYSIFHFVTDAYKCTGLFYLIQQKYNDNIT